MTPLLLLSAVVFVGVWVNYGVFRGIDRYAFHHSEPLRRTDWRLLTSSAEVPFAGLLLLFPILELRKVGRRREAAAWMLAFVGSLMVEMIGKAVVTRPYAGGSRLLGTPIVQGTFPSGHTMRSIIVAAALCAAWPRYRFWFIAWAALTIATVEATGMHSPSEITAGVLGGLGIVAAVRATATQDAACERAAAQQAPPAEAGRPAALTASGE
jgi:membrane-associated phospholipid phosphatase